MIDPFSMLESDHRLVEKLLGQLSDSEEGPEREQLVEKLTAALQLHMQFEEQHVYTQVTDEESAEEAGIEHQLARDGLSKLSELVAAPGFGAAVAMLEAGIDHHVEEEEQEMFPELRSQLGDDDQAELARRLVEAKRDAGQLADSLEVATKDDLLGIAEALGLEATSSMTKDELSELLTTAAG